MNSLINIYKLVHRVLIDYPETRNSDYLLVAQIWQEITISKQIDSRYILNHLRNQRLPSWDYITRARRLIVNKHPELKGNRKVEQKRAENKEIIKRDLNQL